MNTVTIQREHIRQLFFDICAKYPLWVDIDVDHKCSLVRKMERSCLEHAINLCKEDGISCTFENKIFIERYSAICSKVISNLDVEGLICSDYLINKIIRGEIDVCDIASMSSYDLCPMASEQERNEISIRLKQNATTKVSTAYKCRKCGGNRTVHIEYQSRAADESSSKSIKCEQCGFVWRV